jgi:hypothetical protein
MKEWEFWTAIAAAIVVDIIGQNVHWPWNRVCMVLLLVELAGCCTLSLWREVRAAKAQKS